MRLCIWIYTFYSAVVIFLPTLLHSNVFDLVNMLVLGREEKNSFMLNAAILSTEELDFNSAFTWSSHTLPAV